MKLLRLMTEGQWQQRNVISLSQEQESLLQSTIESDKAAQEELQQYIASQLYSSPLSEDEQVAQAKYIELKPNVTGNETYLLICMDVMFSEDNSISGILNYRVNEDHRQIRF